MQLNWNFLGEGRGIEREQNKSPSGGGGGGRQLWIFSGTSPDWPS